MKHALNLTRVNLSAQASTKKRALELVSECCAVAYARPDFFQALVEREKLGSTGLGHGVALPHARLAHLHEPLACFLRLDKGIDYESPDQEPVDLIIGLFVPEDAPDAHLHLLSHIAQRLSLESVRMSLRYCNDPQEAFSMITQPLGDIVLVS